MSYILESLKKSEKERREKATESPIEQVYDAALLDSTNSQHNRYKYYVIVLLLVLLLVFAVGLWALFLKGPDTLETDGRHIALANKQAGTRVFATDEKSLDAEKTKKIEVDQLYQKLEAEKKTAAILKQKAELEKAKASSDKSPDKSPEKNLGSQATAKPQPTTPAAVDALNKKEEVLPAQERDDPVAATEQKPLIKSFNQLSLLARDGIPSISYSAHVYAEDNRSGFVIINGRKQRTGSRLLNGLFLEKIEEDAIILSYDGLVFKMPAMTSWINN